MCFVEKVRLLQRLDALIKRKGTGNHKDLASRLDVSIPTLYRRLEELRSLGAEIAYSNDRQSYFYENDFELF